MPGQEVERHLREAGHLPVSPWCDDTHECLKVLDRNKLISDAEMRKDIEDTEAEIAQMEEEAMHLERTPLSLPSARLDHMRASARRSGIQERIDFVRDLHAILELRINIR